MTFCATNELPCKNKISPSSKFNKDNVTLDQIFEYDFVVGRNEFNLSSSYQAKKGQLVSINFSGKLALNTSSDETDYIISSKNNEYSFSKLNNNANWRFCFKTFIRYEYFEKTIQLEHRYGFGIAPVEQNVYPFILSIKSEYKNSSFKGVTHIVNRSYRFVGMKNVHFYTFYAHGELSRDFIWIVLHADYEAKVRIDQNWSHVDTVYVYVLVPRKKDLFKLVVTIAIINIFR